ncbi:peptidylprolyl isomerase [Caulobacter hibisci]|uniref:peptidylprolyl isomerase n=1 Tax=Caulobacter hibisci TaxID=2035993 RepID=A0ABS0SWE4_9CAUL|nr:peptidylprolyl isomerase [Caulobacter hibisci]MBI1683023.1 peptidylprolyl isomerase [Caulobacter hibisci]
MDRRLFLAAAAAAAATSAHAQETTPAPQPAVPPQPAPKPPTRVAIETALGRIVIALHTKEAPITTANFLRYVDQKRYDGATFFRASRAPGAPEYGLIQGGVQGDPKRVLPPIAHESTTKTGLKHVSGTVSIARNAPGSATSDFFILIGDAPGLDANPAASGDNLGFAAFGTVVEGMDVAQKILALPTPGKAINPVMKGQIIDPPLKIVSARRVP